MTPPSKGKKKLGGNFQAEATTYENLPRQGSSISLGEQPLGTNRVETSFENVSKSTATVKPRSEQVLLKETLSGNHKKVS